MFKVLVFLCLGIFANAVNFNVVSGEIMAHTEVFGDSEINPKTNEIKGDLIFDNSIESLKGKIYFKTLSLISNKKDRDSNMYELLNSEKFSTISFTISQISKYEDRYKIDGILSLNGVSKNISSLAQISLQNNQLTLNGDFSILLTNFEMSPPTLLFLTVRDQIDITYNILLK